MISVPAEATGRLSDAWRACVGTGRIELALRRDYQDSLALLQREIGFRYIRGHGLLSDGMGVYRPYAYEGARRVHHSFTYVDQVVDAYLGLHVRPFLELGFMPTELASGDQTVFWWRGNVTPPRSYDEWARLVRATLTHLVDRYGIEEVRTWPIEVWNEPNLTDFWQGADEAEYHRLYEVTARTVKDVDASLQVGGPAISPGADEWLLRFAEFAERREVPVDFVSRHAYTSGPARPVPFGAYQTLAPARRLLDQFARPREQLKGTRYTELPVHITEFNSSYRPDNPIHDTAFHAAYLAPVLAAGGDHADSFSYWTFSDMFEESGVPTALFHGGFGLLTHRQVKKPTYHLYAFMARMGRNCWSAATTISSPATPTVGSPYWPGRPSTRPAAHRARTGTPCGCPCPWAGGRAAPPSSGAPPWTRSTATRGPRGGTWAARARPGPTRSICCTRPPNPPAAICASPSRTSAPTSASPSPATRSPWWS
ncbi:hypothetical protein SAV31267_082460 [Streptomyces avermitilis]|uniref:Glycosyl hydrolases family 39 N-terminal catalytic domain-containing protein n=1 Tax=Streptomyces avermitilis TaxID=33903 RepID=A0A4D4N2M9_STRAX|nr:hypothetical protein SAV31267_082460 [Streptomyces avermitilis]